MGENRSRGEVVEGKKKREATGAVQFLVSFPAVENQPKDSVPRKNPSLSSPPTTTTTTTVT